MIDDKGIFIKNIYYMLTYAFRVLKQSNYEEIEAEEFENIHDLYSVILGKGIAQQLKQGVYREYIEKQENLSAKRGKLNMQENIQNKMQHRQMLFCEFDELSENNIFNQILKTTIMLLVRQQSVRTEHKAVLKKELLFFQEIDFIEPQNIRWNTLRFQRNNQSYRMLMNICNLVLDGLLLSNEQGTFRGTMFLDEQRMCRLYEKFILEYFRYHHPELQASAAQISWNLDTDNKDDAIMEFLPVMKSDVMLKSENRTLIIDAKYYEYTMQTQFEMQKFHSDHLYQIFAYVKNLDKDNIGNVSGMLLYAKTGEQIQPNNDFFLDGNKISVKTLDLNLPFRDIADQLEVIAGSL